MDHRRYTFSPQTTLRYVTTSFACINNYYVHVAAKHATASTRLQGVVQRYMHVQYPAAWCIHKGVVWSDCDHYDACYAAVRHLLTVQCAQSCLALPLLLCTREKCVGSMRDR